MCKIVEQPEIKAEEWERLINESPVTSWFQTYEAYSCFDSLSFLEAFAFGVESNGCLKGLIVGYIQQDGGTVKRFFTRRAIINGGPLLAKDIKKEELSMLLMALKNKMKSKAIYVEFRNYNDYSQWRVDFEEKVFSYNPHYDVHVDTSNLETVNSELNRNRKRNIKETVENGLAIDAHLGESELKIFFGQLEKLYKEKVKMPLYSYEFFEKLYRLPSSRFFVAKEKEENVIGGMINICHAAEFFFHTYDFMGAGKPDDVGYGVRDFKLKFGGKLLEFGRFDYICNPMFYSLG